MIEQLKTFDNNTLAIEVIDGFTETDKKLCQKWFEEKRVQGFVFLSKTALLIALFNHLYIWVHYYFTENPDIKFIYRT